MLNGQTPQLPAMTEDVAIDGQRDDRIEMRSYGHLPNGITVKQLSRKHISKPTNPLIAGAFHRTGAVEVWGRGTNRVIEMCKKHGAAPSTFEEMQGFLPVTFKAQMVAGGATGTSEAQSIRILGALSRGTLSARALADALGMRSKTGALKRTLSEMLSETLIEYTLPDKPNSRLQKYRLTLAGERALKERFGEEDR
jgi:ATP-dependent DNA helicase RecG